MERPGESRTRWLVLVVAVIALLLRVVYLYETAASPLFGFHVVDASTFEEMTQRILRDGEWLWTNVENYTPAYPWMLASLRMLTGEHVWTVKVFQHLCGTLSAVLVALITLRVCGNRAAWIAGLVYAAYWPIVVYESEQFAESLSLFFSLLAVWLVVRPRMGGFAVLGCGLAWAAASLLRANLLLAAPLFALWIAYRHRGKPSRITAHLALWIIGFVLLLIPILWRNHELTGKWMLRRQANWSLYSGLDPAFGGLAIAPGVQFEKFMLQPHREGKHSPAEIEAYWKEKTRALVGSHFPAVALNLAKRAAMLVSATEYSKEFDLSAYRARSRALSLPWPGWGWIFPFALVGLAFVGRSPWRWWLVAIVAVLFLSILPFKLADRYRLALVAFLIPVAAHGCSVFVSALRHREGKRSILAVVCLAAGAAASWPDWFQLQANKLARHDFFLGSALKENGQHDEAIAAYRRSMAAFPWDADSPYAAAHLAWKQLKNAALAQEFLQEALQREPEFPTALELQAEIRLHEGDLAGALQSVDQAAALHPTGDRMLLRARIIARDKKTEAAVEAYVYAIRVEDTVSGRFEFALYLDSVGRSQEALNLLHPVVSGESRSSSYQRGRAFMLSGFIAARVGRIDVARKVWADLLQANVGDAFTRQEAAFMLDGNESAFRNALSKPDAEAEYAVATVWRLQGNRQKARDSLQRTLETPALSVEARASDPHGWAREELQRP